MKPSIKFSLLGAIAGAVVMLIIAVIFECVTNRHPGLDTQVIHYLEDEGYPVDTVSENIYAFKVNGDNIIFEYYPNDQTYLRLFAGYNVDGFSFERVQQTCYNVMETKKNCIIIPDKDEDNISIQIGSESFIGSNCRTNAKIIERSIKVIEESHLFFISKLYEME